MGLRPGLWARSQCFGERIRTFVRRVKAAAPPPKSSLRGNRRTWGYMTPVRTMMASKVVPNIAANTTRLSKVGMAVPRCHL